MDAVGQALRPESERRHLDADQFTLLVQQFGISCYDRIPPCELEICTDQYVTCRSIFSGFIELTDLNR
jgi:hypothetical protein